MESSSMRRLAGLSPRSNNSKSLASTALQWTFGGLALNGDLEDMTGQGIDNCLTLFLPLD
jgi:hypothetical protein